MKKVGRLWRKVLLAVGGSAVVLVLIEGMLALFGVDPDRHIKDPFVGFSGYRTLFVPRTSADGTALLATASNKLDYFNAQAFAATKAPGTTRIFCVGGSTTYGRPFDDTTSFCAHLRDLLKRAAPDRRWEVINAGGISYASYRVALVMEELAHYDPDLFVIYCGHNEFLEERTYGNIRRVPRLALTVVARSARTRLYTLVRSVLAPATLRRPEGRLLAAEVAPILDRSVGPSAYKRDDAKRRQVLAHYRFSLERMVDTAHARGAEVLLVTPASNLAGCSPFKSQHGSECTAEELSHLTQLLSQAVEACDAGGDYSDVALKAYDAECAIDPRYARAHYARGKLLLSLGRDADAAEALRRARDEDICPLRAVSEQAGIVADVAKAHGACLVDFQQLAATCSPHGIPGEMLFVDHVHLTSEGNALLAAAILRTMASAGYVALPDTWGDADVAAVAAGIAARVNPALQGKGYLNLARVLTWAGKFDEADRPSERAVALLQTDADAWYHRALVVEQTRGDGEAEALYRRAVRLRPDHALAQNNLGAIRVRQGRIDEGVALYRTAVTSDPRLVVARKNLGVLLAGRRDFTEALNHLNAAAAVDPTDPEIFYDIGRIHLACRQSDKAAAAFRRALQVEPDFTPARKQLDSLGTSRR